MTSQDGRYCAARSARCLASAAVREKLPAAITPSFLSLAVRSMSEKSAAVSPELPITTRTPRLSASIVLSLTESWRRVVHENIRWGCERFLDRLNNDDTGGGQAQNFTGVLPGRATSDGPDKLELIRSQDRTGDGTARPAAHPRHAHSNRHVCSRCQVVLHFTGNVSTKLSASSSHRLSCLSFSTPSGATIIRPFLG